MLSGLILSAFLMGLGGMAHCATMCGAPCALAFPRGVPWLALLGRCVAYAGLGAIAAFSAGTVATWARQMAFLRPLWLLALLAVILFGLFLVRAGRMPRAFDAWGLAMYRRARDRWSAVHLVRASPTLRAIMPLLGGMAWVVMPCGLLYAALMVAALAPSASSGAAVMLAFALPGAFGVWAAPFVLRQLSVLLNPRGQPAAAPPPEGSAPEAGQPVPVIWIQAAPSEAATVSASTRPPFAPLPSTAQPIDPAWAVRASGLMLALMGTWAMYHQLLAQWRAWCA